MGKLHTWAVTIAAVVVGLSPGLAILSARPIARLIRGTLWPRPVDNRGAQRLYVPSFPGRSRDGDDDALGRQGRGSLCYWCRYHQPLTEAGRIVGPSGPLPI